MTKSASEKVDSSVPKAEEELRIPLLSSATNPLDGLLPVFWFVKCWFKLRIILVKCLVVLSILNAVLWGLCRQGPFPFVKSEVRVWFAMF